MCYMKCHSESLCVFCVCVAASGQGLFHPSWLLCVYQRMFHSENKSLMREGVCHLLELQVLQQPDFAVAFSQVQAQTLAGTFTGQKCPVALLDAPVVDKT